MSTLLLTHPCFLDHDTGEGHPERPDRMRVLDKVFSDPRFDTLVREEAPLRDDCEEAILRVHPDIYLERLKRLRPEPGKPAIRLDPDTVLSSGTWEAALRAVGAGLEAVDKVFEAGNGILNAFCQVRPCGHHAEKERAMGFCIFSNIAIAAHYARARHGAERVAVVDFDVHHGNGTQDVFWSDKDLFLASTHQMPLYPGTGAPSEEGTAGNICNAPLRPNDAGPQFRDAFNARVLPALNDFGPDLILISAGFDAHEADPLANLRLVEDDFVWATDKLMNVAEHHCRGRVVSMLEGGYDLAALGRSAGAHVELMMGA
jgi:acetoin utilization deacetylase AcuC-like enzyme